MWESLSGALSRVSECNSALTEVFTTMTFFDLFLVIYRRPNLLFIIMNDPLVNIDIDVNLFNNIYPDINGNQSSEYYDCPKFNKLSMISNTHL